MSKKEVVVKEETAMMVAPQVTLDDWGNDNEMTANDLVIPKILVQQGMSKYVTEGTARFGEFCDSLTGEILGDSDKKPIEVIPFHMQKVWVVSKKIPNKDKPEYVRTEQVTPENEMLPWEFEEDGQKFIRALIRNFYCVVPSRRGMCYVVPFKGKSARSGKILATQMFTTNKLAKLTPAGMVIELTAKKESNDDGTFMVMYVKPLKETPSDLLVEAFNWYKLVKSGATKVDESDLKEEPTFSSDDRPF